jgi:Alcohol dehydrogenase GroES-like domain
VAEQTQTARPVDDGDPDRAEGRAGKAKSLRRGPQERDLVLYRACEALRTFFLEHEGGVEMSALVDHGPETTASEEVRDPTLQADTDAILRVDAVTTCDEAVGTVEAVGPGVRTVEVGDRVLVSCITSCGAGSFAELVRVPLADMSTYKVPEGVTDGEMLMLATFFRRATPPSAAA